MNAAAAVVGFVFVLTSVVLLDAVAAASAISCPAGVVPLTNALFAVPRSSRVHAIGYCDANGGPVNYYYVVSTNGGVDFSVRTVSNQSLLEAAEFAGNESVVAILQRGSSAEVTPTTRVAVVGGSRTVDVSAVLSFRTLSAPVTQSATFVLPAQGGSSGCHSRIE